MKNIQFDLFENRGGKRISKIHLEELADACTHISTFGYKNYDCTNNFRRGELYICVFFMDYENLIRGQVRWKGKEVFSYKKDEKEIWKGKENCEDMGDHYRNEDFVLEESFHIKTYITGDWEKIVKELYEESMDKKDLRSDEIFFSSG